MNVVPSNSPSWATGVHYAISCICRNFPSRYKEISASLLSPSFLPPPTTGTRPHSSHSTVLSSSNNTHPSIKSKSSTVSIMLFVLFCFVWHALPSFSCRTHPSSKTSHHDNKSHPKWLPSAATSLPQRRSPRASSTRANKSCSTSP